MSLTSDTKTQDTLDNVMMAVPINTNQRLLIVAAGVSTSSIIIRIQRNQGDRSSAIHEALSAKSISRIFLSKAYWSNTLISIVLKNKKLECINFQVGSLLMNVNHYRAFIYLVSTLILVGYFVCFYFKIL